VLVIGKTVYQVELPWVPRVGRALEKWLKVLEVREENACAERPVVDGVDGVMEVAQA